MLLMSYFLIRGTLNRKSATKLIALVNGIDITGNRLQKIMKQTEDLEQPSCDEILAERKMKSLDMDIRLRSQQEFRDELSLMLSELRDDQDRFSNRLLAFRTELKEIGSGFRFGNSGSKFGGNPSGWESSGCAHKFCGG